MEGAPELVVDHGSIRLEGLKKENLSKEDLFRALRSKDVKHLGEVQKAFVETTGQVSVLFHAPKNIKPGLSVLPENQVDESRIIKSKTTIEEPGEYCCVQCGSIKTFNEQRKAPACEVCSGEEWVKAIH